MTITDMTQNKAIANNPNVDPDNPGVGVRARHMKDDPRLNKKQAEAIENATKIDRDTLVMGLDEHNHPVVRARAGLPRETRTWAILRNGDPATPGKLYEPWHEGR